MEDSTAGMIGNILEVFLGRDFKNSLWFWKIYGKIYGKKFADLLLRKEIRISTFSDHFAEQFRIRKFHSASLHPWQNLIGDSADPNKEGGEFVARLPF